MANKKAARDTTYRPGTLRSYEHIPAHVPSVLFCMESSSPFGVGKVVRERELPLVAHVVSHSWFENPRVLWVQLERMLQMQARAHGVEIVVAANEARSVRYSARGAVTKGAVRAEGDVWRVVEYYGE